MKVGTRKITHFGAVCALAAGFPAVAAETNAVLNLDSNDTIIVTGTRVTGMKAADSTTPIEVVGAEALEATGQNNIFDALKDVVPSFSSSPGGDYGAFIRSARLRGLAPGEVLILVNGKRRHQSAYVDTGGPDVGSNPVDLDFIPIGMIDHVEILLDGAAAQYGSDAIAGVMNIILKSDSHGVTLNSTNGITSRGDGEQSEATASAGFELGHGGFVDVTANYLHHDYSLRDQGIPSKYATSEAFGRNGTTSIFNRINGDPLTDQANLGYNLDLPLGLNWTDAQVYAFATAGYRHAIGYENYRSPTVAPKVYPQGFFPRETLTEWDFSVTEGVKGTIQDWSWDLSNTYGRDDLDQGIIHTINPNFYTLYGYSPTSAKTGGQTASQLTTNLDVSKPIQTGLWSAPLNVAIGVEHRYETYTQIAGDSISYVNGGTQAFAGFTPQSASDSSRDSESGYIDLSTRIVPEWQIDLAGRFENYTDVGTTKNGRFSTRYDFATWLGLRASISDGFHAPTLAQDNFAVANVGPVPGGGNGQAYSLQLPTTSPGAAVLGAPKLRPERDNDVSIGIVSELTKALHFSIDAYQIYISDRIISTGSIGNSTNALGNSLALAAAGANGFSVPAGSTATVNFFTNGADTRTRGLDFSLDYKQDLGAWGVVKWSFAGNQNDTSITKYHAPSATLAAAGLTYFTPASASYLTDANPQNKFTLAPTWMWDRWDVTVRETRYGHVDDVFSYGSPLKYYNQVIPSAYITDIEVGYQVLDAVKMSLGVNNVFDKMPETAPAFTRSARNTPAYPSYAPYGISGTYAFGRITATF